jgi:hypothetical protein
MSGAEKRQGESSVEQGRPAARRQAVPLGRPRRAARRLARAFPHRVLVGMFLAVLWLPLLGMAIFPERDPQRYEARRPAPFPRIALDIEALTSFPSGFEDWFGDRLGFRSLLVRLASVIRVKGLGVSTDERVLLGKDDWLYMAAWPAPKRDSVLRQHRGARLFSAEELARWQSVLETRRDRLAARGIRYLFVVVPHKHSIYPEHLPDYLTGVGKLTPTDQFVAHLRAGSDVAVLDLRPSLRAAKGSEPLYWRTDTHWTDFGAHVGYLEIMRVLSEWFPALRPRPREAFVPQVHTERGDLSRALGLGGLDDEIGLKLTPRWGHGAQAVDVGGLPLPPAAERAKRVTVSEVAGGGLPRAVVLHDSYAYDLMPFLSEHFSRVVYLRRPGTRAFLDGRERSEPYLQALIDFERPDVVIDQVVERNLIWAFKDYE